MAGSGLVGVTYGLAEIGVVGTLIDPRVLFPLLAGAVLVVCFVRRCLHIDRPLLDMGLYKNKAFSAASLTTFCFGAGIFGGMILMPLYYQIVRHQSPVATGLLMAPQGLGAMISMRLSPRFTDRYGSGVTALGGAIIATLATVPFVLIGATTPFAVLAAAMVVRGIGTAASIMPAITAAFRALAPDQISDASPQLNVLMRVGGSVGVALLTVVLQRQLTQAGTDVVAQAAAFGNTFWWVLGLMTVTIVPTVLLLILERRSPTTGSELTIPVDTLLEVA
jgi:MFS family permease